MINRVLSIDPGRSKCGLAIVSRAEGVLARTVVELRDLRDTARLLASRFEPEVIVVGSGTGADAVAASVAGIPLPLRTVDERLTSQKARVRYFQDNPPRGWRRLVPRSLLTPPVPCDDYAAVLLAERFLAAQNSVESAENRH